MMQSQQFHAEWIDRGHMISDKMVAEAKARAFGRRFPHVEYRVDHSPLNERKWTILCRKRLP